MPVPRPAALLVLVAVPSPEVADRIAAALLDRRLGACAQVLGPMTSRYRWKGKLERQREWLLLVKSRAALFTEIERAVRALHPYDVPEIVGAPLESVHAPYLRWIESETRQGPAGSTARAKPARPGGPERARPGSPKPARPAIPKRRRRPAARNPRST